MNTFPLGVNNVYLLLFMLVSIYQYINITPSVQKSPTSLSNVGLLLFMNESQNYKNPYEYKVCIYMKWELFWFLFYAQH